MLTGSEREELSSAEDDRNWADRIEERREQFADPMILRPPVDRLFELNAFPELKDGLYEMRWASVSDPSKREQADTVEVWARAAATLQSAGTIVSPEEARERYLGLDPDETPAGEERDQDRQ